MASIDDQAADVEALHRKVAMMQRRPELPRTGYCWNCSEETPGAFCCPECREDYLKREAFNK